MTGRKVTQLILTLIWAGLFAPALLWWKESVPFLVFVSVYANFVGHVSAYEAARAEAAGLTRDEALELLEYIRNRST